MPAIYGEHPLDRDRRVLPHVWAEFLEFHLEGALGRCAEGDQRTDGEVDSSASTAHVLLVFPSTRPGLPCDTHGTSLTFAGLLIEQSMRFTSSPCIL